MGGWTKCLAKSNKIGDRWPPFAFILLRSEGNDLLLTQNKYVRTANVYRNVVRIQTISMSHVKKKRMDGNQNLLVPKH